MTEEIKKPEKKSGKIKSFKTGLVIISILVMFFVGYFFGYMGGSGSIGNLSSVNSLNFRILNEAAGKIQNNYVGKYQKDNLLYGALEGMVSGLGDPYSGIIRAEDIENFYQTIEGEFEGIGIEIGEKNGKILVIAPISGYPADKKGILAGDEILEVDQKNIQNFNLDDIVGMIRGKAGTEVNLKIYRNKTNQTLDFKVVREKIKIKSVSFEVKNKIAYIRIIQFDSDTTKAMTETAEKLKGEKLKGIILDLRDNPGGYLDAAIATSKLFLAKNQTVMYEKKQDGKLRVYKNDADGTLKDFPLVILQNQGSASASEIVTAAIRENRDDVEVLGTQSFGKGLVQEILSLSDKSLLRLSTAFWLTPKKRNLNEKGFTPDIKLDLSENDLKTGNDIQKNQAEKILGGK